MKYAFIIGFLLPLTGFVTSDLSDGAVSQTTVAVTGWAVSGLAFALLYRLYVLVRYRR